MTDVFFQGYGDWFLETSNGIRPLTSKIIPIYHTEPEYPELNDCDIVYTNPVFRDCCSFSSVFKLTPDDEKTYLHSKSKKILKKRVKRLLPSSHPGSSFLEFVEKGLLSKDDLEHCYFQIQTSVKYSEDKPSKDVNFKLKPLDPNLSSTTPPLPLSKVATPANNPNKSEQLSALNLASNKFWGNADREEKTTWPNTKKVCSWLVKNGYSLTLAEKAASIIRPEWAGSGVRPSK